MQISLSDTESISKFCLGLINKLINDLQLSKMSALV
jgi:hypothetical protein